MMRSFCGLSGDVNRGRFGRLSSVVECWSRGRLGRVCCGGWNSWNVFGSCWMNESVSTWSKRVSKFKSESFT